jgi:hypothetical protein
MRPMQMAIEALRDRAGPERIVGIVHTGLPGNDFASLFNALAQTPDSQAISWGNRVSFHRRSAAGNVQVIPDRKSLQNGWRAPGQSGSAKD